MFVCVIDDRRTGISVSIHYTEESALAELQKYADGQNETWKPDTPWTIERNKYSYWAYLECCESSGYIEHHISDPTDMQTAMERIKHDEEFRRQVVQHIYANANLADELIATIAVNAENLKWTWLDLGKTPLQQLTQILQRLLEHEQRNV